MHNIFDNINQMYRGWKGLSHSISLSQNIQKFIGFWITNKKRSNVLQEMLKPNYQQSSKPIIGH